MAKKQFIHDFDIMFSLKSAHEDPDDIPRDRLLAALKERVSGLKPDEIREACGHVQTNEEL